MPRTLRETSFGGLAMKETGKQEKNIYFEKNIIGGKSWVLKQH